MINIINFDKLASYKDDKKKSFEELCYQICEEEFGHLGKFHRIDDSGGGDGIEFYLEISKNEIWGWQCKFFGRFDEGGRKEQIKKSLQTAYKKHGVHLKKWILCSKNNLTPEEQDWFETKLATQKCKGESVLPVKHNIELIHWGDSNMLLFLRKHTNIFNFFFNESIFSFEWFKDHANDILSRTVIKNKYISDVHVECQAQEEVYRTIGGVHLAEIIQQRYNILDVDKFANEFSANVRNIEELSVSEFQDIIDKLRAFAIKGKDIVETGKKLIVFSKALLVNDNVEELKHISPEIQKYQENLKSYYSEFSYLKEAPEVKPIHWDTEKEEKEEGKRKEIKQIREVLFGPYFTLRNYYRPYLGIFDCLNQLDQSEIHITGRASKGKTHLVANVFEQQIKENKPAVFLIGKEFKTDRPIEKQILSLLDIPEDWNMDKFLGLLNHFGKTYSTKTLLIIDGLNESIHWKTIWADRLESFISKIKKYDHLLLITTYRKSYEGQLFPVNYFSATKEDYLKYTEVYGFDDDKIDEAIVKYFNHYNITLINQSNASYFFKEEPLYLQIFCEIKRGKTVDLLNESLFQIFDQYITKCNENIISVLQSLEARYNKQFLNKHLDYISKYLWKNNVSSIPFDKLYPKKLNEIQISAIENENLLIYRDWKNQETLSFTYDLLAGFLIAKQVVNQFTTKESFIEFLKSDLFNSKFLNKDSKHPLYDDILTCLCIMAIKEYDFAFDEITESSYNEYIINALYETSKENIISSEIKIKRYLKELFKTNNKSILRKSSHVEFDPSHPLNFKFTSDLLKSLPLSERDINWSEECRNNYSFHENIKEFLSNVEKACRDERILKDSIHLVAMKIMWYLTTTNHELRHNATKALYFYGKKYYPEFYVLFCNSIGINDLYVLERMLAITYGLALTLQNPDADKQLLDEFLFPIAKCIYSNLFSEKKVIPTTHILIRDYARNTLHVAMIHKKDLFNDQEIDLIENPIASISNKELEQWKEVESCNGPIQMDFSNYTLGYIVPNGNSYDNPPLKKKARGYIYKRIEELGWSIEKFDEIDKNITNRNSYSRHNDSSKIDRYGKKYSWIAYYELAGIFEDLDILENEWNEYRIVNSDLDPTFPELNLQQKLIHEDFLGDDCIETSQWILDGGIPEINRYLIIENLSGLKGDSICLDGFFQAKNEELKRKRFTFIRSLLVNSSEYESVLELLKIQNMDGRWPPEIRNNYDCFAGEMTCWVDATKSNWTEIQFILKEEKERIYQGDPNFNTYYYEHLPIFVFDEDKLTIEKQEHIEIPEFIEIETRITKEFQVLMPVMEYNREDVFSCGTSKVVSKEIIKHSKLLYKPQTFDLLDGQNQIVSTEINFYNGFDDSQKFLFLNKIILDKFLIDNDLKMLWIIWGERDSADQIPGNWKVFQKIVEYDIESIFK